MSGPQVGVGVFIVDPQTGKFILGKRKSTSTGAGTWSLPCGHLEYGESFEECAAREVMEETGLAISDVRFLTVVNSVFEGPQKHYVGVFTGCTISGELKQPQVVEPDLCEGWEWVTWEDVRALGRAQLAGEAVDRGLFLPMLDLLRQRSYFDPISSLVTLE